MEYGHSVCVSHQFFHIVLMGNITTEPDQKSNKKCNENYNSYHHSDWSYIILDHDGIALLWINYYGMGICTQNSIQIFINSIVCWLPSLDINEKLN